MVLNVDIKKRVATYQEGDELPICGNTGDTVKFTFDEEWSEHEKKTARFIWGGKYEDVEFTGDTCEVPVVTNSQVLIVGVYAGELPEDGFMLSSTNVSIRYRLSTRCGNVTPNDVTAHYTNLAKGYAEEAKEAAEEANVFLGRVKAYVTSDEEGNFYIFDQKLPKQDSNGLMTLLLPDEILPYVKRAKLVRVECTSVDAAYLTCACREFVPVSLEKKNTHQVSFSAQTDSWGDPWEDYNTEAVIKRYMHLKSMYNTLTLLATEVFVLLDFYA